MKTILLLLSLTLCAGCAAFEFAGDVLQSAGSGLASGNQYQPPIRCEADWGSNVGYGSTYTCR